MKGKTVIVTGAGSGVGLETSDALARQGAALVLIELDRQRGEAAMARVEKIGLRPRLWVADMSLQRDVRRVANEILTSTPRIDVLINNAGAWFTQRGVTAEGLERTFALNHLGYFLLTNLLLERLKASAPARIISVASDGHAEAALDFSDLQSEKDYSGRTAYCRSKLANVLFTWALARRLQDSGVTVNCLHPGRLLTRFFDNFENVSTADFPGYVAAAEGAKTPVYLASSAEVAEVTGQYFDNCKVIEPSQAARDEAAAERLWAESLRLVGLPDEVGSLP